MRRIARLLVVVAWTWAVTGCATRLDPVRVIPTYGGGPVRTLAIGVTDHRPAVVDRQREEWLEGVTRGAFGIPTWVGRGMIERGEHATPYRAFALRVAHLLAQAIETAGGGTPQVVPLAVGANEQDALAQLAATGTERHLLVVIRASAFDYGGLYLHPDYDYDLEIVVDSPTAELARRRFTAHQADLQSDGSLSFYDNADLYIYRPTLSTILADPAVVTALRRSD